MRGPLTVYGLTLAAVAAAGGVRALFDPVVGDRLPWVTFVLPVALAAWLGGARPALLATALGYAAGLYLFVEPRYAPRLVPPGPWPYALATYLVVCLTLVAFGEAVRAAQRRAAARGRLLEATLAGIGDGVVVADPAGRVTFLNPLAAELTGWPAGEALGRPLTDVVRLLDGATRRPAADLPGDALRLGKAVALPAAAVLAARGGAERSVEGTASPVRDGAGGVAGVVLAVRDVTARRRAEAEAAGGRGRLQALFDTAQDAILLADDQARYVDANPAACALLGYDRQELLGLGLFDVTPPGDAEAGRAAWAAFTRNGRHAGEYVVRRKDGSTAAVECRAVANVQPGLHLSVLRDVGDRRRSEAAARESRQLLQAIVDNWPAAVFVKDLDGRYLLANRAAAALAGVPADALLGKTDHDLVPADVADRFRADDRRVLASGEVARYEESAVLGGAVRTGLTVKFPLADADGRPYAVCGISTDVTDVKRAEEAVRVSEGRLRLATEGAGVGTWEIDLAAGRGTWSPEAVQLCGAGRAAFTADDWVEMVHPDDRAAAAGAWRRAVEAGADYELEFRTAADPGRWLLTRGRVERDPAGRPVRGAGVLLDVTARRRAEEAARAGEAFARGISEVAPCMLYVYDLAGARNVWGNREITAILGYTRDRLDALAGDLVRTLLHPDDRGPYADYLARLTALADGEAAEFEYRMRHADGSWRWLHSRDMAYRRGPDGRVAEIIGAALDVTARRRAEEALRASEDHARRQLAELNALYATAPLGLCVFDRDLRYRRINPELAAINGVPAEAHLGRTVREVLPELADGAEPLLREVLAADRAVRTEFRGTTPAQPGVGRVWDTYWYPIPGPDGAPEGVAVIAQEITDRKRAEDALAEAARSLARERERLAVALRAARLGVYEWRVGDAAVWWSPEIYAVFGVDPAAFTPTVEAFTALVHPDDRAELWRKTEECLARREEFAHEYRVVRPDGAVRWVANRSAVGLDAAGDPERVTGVAADVTERRAAEEALRRGEERLRLATAAGRVGVWEWHVPSNSVSWSDSLYPIHGVSKDQFDGTVEGFTALVHPDDRGPVGDAIRRSLGEGAPYELEFRAVRPDGAVVWLYTQAAVVRDAAGAPVRMLGATVDVSERRRVEDALKEADRRKDEFLATLAHELRNPLAPIRTAIQILNLKGSQEPEARRVRDMVERQVDHLVRLVDDLLDVSRISRGKIALRKDRVGLADVVRAAAETAGPAVAAGRHRLTVEAPADPLAVEGDAVRLTQVVANLLNNAAKYTPEGGAMAVAVERDGPWGVVRVRDTGLGIPADMLGRVFEMFAQVNKHLGRAQGGLGIGLSLVRQLVELHGGTVEARSEGEGRGAEFVVRLPLAAPAAEPPGRAAGPAAVTPRRILVVDDNVDAADSLAALLSLTGHDVRTAHNGPAGVDQVVAFRPDVVFLDLGMPGVDGYETARRVRATDAGRAAVLVALTGWGQEEDRRRTRAAGFDHHLVKPVDPAALDAFLAAAP